MKMSPLKAFVFLTLVGLSAACLITNCPKGGKRSPSLAGRGEILKENQASQCIRCGPGLAGRCVGPILCCGPMTGCTIAGPSELAQCRTAVPQQPTHTCVINALPGTCVANAICCSQDTCRIDASCGPENALDLCLPSRIDNSVAY